MTIDKKVFLLYSIFVSWFGSNIWIGKSYIGSWWGNIIFISSSLFLVVFFILNHIKVEEIKEKSLRILGIKHIDALLILYSIIFVILLIVNSFKPPSSFLISIFFIYLILTIAWVLVFEDNKFTKFSFLLLVLSLLPLCIGLLATGKEDKIENSIESLSSRVVYYEDNLDNITNGVLTKNNADNVRYNLQSLKSDIATAKRYYLSGNLGGAEGKIEHAEEIDKRLTNYFNLLDPKKALFDMLQSRDRTLKRPEISPKKISLNYSNCNRVEITQIMVDINSTKDRLDDAWNFYRKGDFQISYNLINDIDNEINNIEERVDRCGLYQISYAYSYSPITLILSPVVVIITILLLILFRLLSRRKKEEGF